ncbi:DUF4177 domain-containing protein [Halorubellus sp. PRR65]|uniref:DUF4177 domain-containing protein n=1 Tax=Halorubellus sp. PRR65 TaxID=3098148 RepID=UPI002B26104F|nr:DUF4177 domain-containing protein [Halorubellus sp. PRR65]
MSTRQQWEYKVVDLSTSFLGKSVEDPEDRLNELGRDGWELVEDLSEASGNSQSLVFKRPR